MVTVPPVAPESHLCDPEWVAAIERMRADGCSAGVVLHEYLRARLAEFLACDPRVRHGEPESVHQMRVATREVRTALTTFRPLVARQPNAMVCSELGALGEYLGRVRDAEVSRTRIAELLVAGSVTSLAAEELAADLDEATQDAQLRLRRALESSRYQKLVQTMSNLVADPPFAVAASGQAGEIMPALMRPDWRRLSRSYGKARRTPPGQLRDELLHKIRKTAKRVRYSAEVVLPVFGSRAEKFAQSVRELQTLLGSHHDSVEMRGVLRRLAVDGDLSDVAVYYRLQAIEQENAEQIERQLPKVWQQISARHRGWLH